MKKNMYSLILAEDVVNAIDKLAEEENTSRSNLINEILAEYVSVTTPEKRINDIFHGIEDLFKQLTGQQVYYQQHDNTLSIKSALEYRYRPTIRYEVELYRAQGGTVGELKVNFRTQSPQLLNRLTEFFALWTRLEELYVARYFNDSEINYTLDETRWTRTLAVPKNAGYDDKELSRAITDYVSTFDRLMKKRLSGAAATEIENEYLDALNGGMIII